MSNLIYEGVVIDKTPRDSYTDINKTMHDFCEIVVQSEEEYPQRLCITLIDDKCANAPEINQRVRCYLKCKAGKSELGKWFNHIKAWKVDAV